MPSPGSRTKLSSPAPSSARSLPLLPSIVSLPSPPISSAPAARRSACSFPAPPSIVVGMLSVKAPLLSSIRTRSSPARPSMAMLAMRLRAKLKSAELLAPRSTSRTPGSPASWRSQLDCVACLAAPDGQHTVLQPRALAVKSHCADARPCGVGAAVPCGSGRDPAVAVTAATASTEACNVRRCTIRDPR